MKKPKFIILAGSAGAFAPIFEIIKNLPESFSIPILIILHRGKSTDNIDEILSRKNNSIIKEIKDKDKIEKGIVYLAPADYHVLIENNLHFAIDISEKINFNRPSIDVTMESAAMVFRERLLGVLFSGANKDGAKGLLKIKNFGGLSIVQSLDDAMIDEMPKAAIKINAQTKILTAKEIELLLLTLV